MHYQEKSKGIVSTFFACFIPTFSFLTDNNKRDKTNCKVREKIG